MKEVKLLFNGHDVPIALMAHGKRHGEIESNYQEKTSNLLKELFKLSKDQKSFVYQGVNYWQFMPSYLTPFLRLTLKINDILATHQVSWRFQDFLDEAIKCGALPSEIRDPWTADFKFFARFLLYRTLKIATRRSRYSPRGGTCLMTMPRHLKNGKDLEFESICKEMDKVGAKYFFLDTPYYSGRYKRFGLRQIYQHKCNRQNSSIFFEDYFDFRSLAQTLRLRVSRRNLPGLKIHSPHSFLNDAVEYFTRHASRQLLPYGAFFYFLVSEKIISRTELNQVAISYEAGPFGRAMILSALESNIKTIGLVHGMMLTWPNEDYSHPVQNADSKMDFTPPKVTCVYGKAQYQALTQLGSYKTKNVAVVGNWKKPAFPSKGNNRLTNAEKGRVTFFDAMANESLYKLVALSLKKANINPKKIYLRPHPAKESEAKKLWLKTGLPAENILFSKEMSSFEVIAQSELCIHDLSSTIIEAAAMKKSVLYTTNTHHTAFCNIPEKNRFSSSEELYSKVMDWNQGESFQIEPSFFYDESIPNPSAAVVEQLLGEPV